MSEKPIYILSVHPIMDGDSIIWDVFFLKEDSTDLCCLRIFNIELSFLVARLPGLRLDQFKRLMLDYTGELHTEIRTDLIDASYYAFGKRHEYIEIFSQSPFILNKVYKQMFKDFEFVYSNVNPDKLPPYDQLFYRNTETPFRFTSTSLKFENTIYGLSTKYGISLVGGARLDTSRLTRSFPQRFLPEDLKPSNIYGLNAQLSKSELEELDKQIADYKAQEDPKISRILNHSRPQPVSMSYNSGNKTPWNYFTVNGNIRKSIIHDDKVDFKRNMTMLSYDIETYNRSTMDPKDKEAFIFCIGMGLFNLVNQKPWKRICIISKQFDTLTPRSLDGERILKAIRGKHYGYPTVSFKYEYNPADETDTTEYITVRNERELLDAFICVINEYKPQVINGFNSFAFDDNYVWQRMNMYGLAQQYLRCFTYYDLDEIEKESWYKSFKPEFKQFEIKIDGELRQDNASVRSPLVLTVDVRKLMLKEDPKRFTMYGRGNLDTMLEVYKVVNPYTNQPLSKTGLHYEEMFNYWDESSHIYEIGIYCVQDSWICGTLLIKRMKISDLIELAGVSNTTMSDSLYRADGNRVQNCVLGYAYKDNFAFMDVPFEKRKERKHDKSIVQYGGKEYDHRTIVGGCVRCVHPGRQFFIVALDYSSAYPSFKEAANGDSSAFVDIDIIKHPEKYGLKIVAKKTINAEADEQDVYYFKLIDE